MGYSRHSSYEERPAEDLDVARWESPIELNPFLGGGQIYSRTGTAATASLGATLTVIVSSPTGVITVIMAPAARGRATAEVTSASAGRSAAPATIGGSRPSSATETLRGSYAIAKAPITYVVRHRRRGTPRLLSRSIRVRRRGTGGLSGRWHSAIAGSHALDQSRDLVKGNTLVSERLDQHDLLLRARI